MLLPSHYAINDNFIAQSQKMYIFFFSTLTKISGSSQTQYLKRIGQAFWDLNPGIVITSVSLDILTSLLSSAAIRNNFCKTSNLLQWEIPNGLYFRRTCTSNESISEVEDFIRIVIKDSANWNTFSIFHSGHYYKHHRPWLGGYIR